MRRAQPVVARDLRSARALSDRSQPTVTICADSGLACARDDGVAVVVVGLVVNVRVGVDHVEPGVRRGILRRPQGLLSKTLHRRWGPAARGGAGQASARDETTVRYR